MKLKKKHIIKNEIKIKVKWQLSASDGFCFLKKF